MSRRSFRHLLVNGEVSRSGQLRGADGTCPGDDPGGGVALVDDDPGYDATDHGSGGDERDQNDMGCNEPRNRRGCSRTAGGRNVGLGDCCMSGQLTLAGGDIDMQLASMTVGMKSLGVYLSIGVGLPGKGLRAVEKAAAGVSALGGYAEKDGGPATGL